MPTKPQIFIISGKSPVRDSGGYAAYAYNLSQILTTLGFPVHTFAIRDVAAIDTTPSGTIHYISTRLLSVFPMLRQLALAGLPYYSILIYRAMRSTIVQQKVTSCIIWGMGPWTFPGALLKLFPPPHTRVQVIANYYTSTRHEMKGALRAIRVADYGVVPKIKYIFVYELVARIFHVFESLALSISDQVIVHYQSSKRIVQSYFHVPSRKIRLFPWYVEIFPRTGQLDTKVSYRHPLIVSICRQDPRKGLNFLVSAMEEVVKVIPRAHCLIVGTGELLELNKKLVQKLHLENNVSVLGFVTDIRPVLKEADIAVIVPLAQGSSALTVLEAMSYGKAIVGSRCDGIPEDIKNNISGLLVQPGDCGQLTQAIIKLCRNPLLRKRLGKNAYRAYRERFGLDIMLKNVKEALQF